MSTIVLLSGGLDSAVVLAATIGERLALAFDYGQPHRIELERAAAIAQHYKTPFKVETIPATPKVGDVVFAGRNLLLASRAIAIAHANSHRIIALGCNATDWPNFPDCRPQFWRALETCAEAYGVRVMTPLIYHSKRDVVAEARRLGVPIELTWSCYDPQGTEPCGHCLACKTREEALK